MRDLGVFTVDSSVQFHDEPELIAAEVRDEGPDRDLSPELEPAEASVAEELPQGSLCGRGLLAKLARPEAHLAARREDIFWHRSGNSIRKIPPSETSPPRSPSPISHPAPGRGGGLQKEY